MSYTGPSYDKVQSDGPFAPERLSPDFQIVEATSPSGVAIPMLTPMGRVTATGEFIRSVKTATDGSQVMRAVTAAPVPASAGARKVQLYTAGKLNKALVLAQKDASYTNLEVETALFDAGIFLEGTV